MTLIISKKIFINLKENFEILNYGLENGIRCLFLIKEYLIGLNIKFDFIIYKENGAYEQDPNQTKVLKIKKKSIVNYLPKSCQLECNDLLNLDINDCSEYINNFSYNRYMLPKLQKLAYNIEIFNKNNTGARTI
ncbi:hypothetical protein BpHYR1_024524 [Brachionus plicatilis]|uniref:Uncharacterized protein n=1 Tax=Brachionus plicatilis TaxID=10195 RepID=A0A3M7RAI0_BRAPC|nr:hypothetical protein BpHYR1_024524 [Brachionus plicatilis]